jgi:hypothetical protein
MYRLVRFEILKQCIDLVGFEVFKQRILLVSLEILKQCIDLVLKQCNRLGTIRDPQAVYRFGMVRGP